MRIPLTDKQRKWLLSLDDEDIHPFKLTVRFTLADGWYTTTAQKNLKKLVDNYKKKRNL